MHRGFPTVLVFLVFTLALWGFGFWLTHAGAPLLSQAAIVIDRPVPSAGWGSLRVMTANIRVDMPEDGVNAWTSRRDLLVRTLLKYQPDVLGCQEVAPAQGAFLNKSLSPWYGYFPRAGAGTQSKPITDVGGLRGAAAQLVGAAGELLSGLNTLYYRTDRFDFIDGESGMILPDQPQPIASENTFFTLAVLREKAGGKAAKPLTVIAVDAHFRHDEGLAEKCAAALRQKIAGWAEKFPDSGILVMGDMNHDRRSPMYDLLTGQGRPSASPLATRDHDTAPMLTDSFDYNDALHSQWATYHAFTGQAARGFPSDLIFFGGPLELKTAAQIERDNDAGRYPSDHFFITADVQRKP